MPIYNSGKYLDRCLRSLQAQTYHNIEFILIDDGSTDDSAAVCRKYCQDDSRFIYVYQNNKGVSAARNKGLETADGDYIAFCDSDDRVDSDIYEILFDLLKKNNAGVACCSFVEVTDYGESGEADESREVVASAKDVLINVIFDGSNVGGVELWTKLIKRDVIKDIKFREDIAIGEDAVFLYEVLKNCDIYAYTTLRKYKYFYNPSSACNSQFKDTYWSINTSAKVIYENVKKDFPDQIYFADRLVILSNLSIAEKLVKVKKLNKTNYKIIRENIKPHLSAKAVKSMTRRRKINLKLLLAGRLAFTAARKIFGK